MNILAESIRVELDLADWQLGVMSGLSFALFYATLGLPIARFAERHHRPRIIATAVLVWSAATAMCGMCRSFPEIALARLVVGIGEAGGTPPSHSLIVEYTPVRERAGALAVYSMGIPVGALFGLALGGLIAANYGWRVAFFVAGIPGVFLALLSVVILREPRQQQVRSTDPAPAVGFWKALAQLFRIRTFRYLLLSSGAMSITGYATSVYIAPFILRAHNAQLQQLSATYGLKPVALLGLVLGLAYGVPGLIGTWAGGRIADRWAMSTRRAYLLVPAIAALICAPLYVLALSVQDLTTTFLCIAGMNLFAVCYVGPLHASAQSIVPRELRATVSAVLLFNISLIGLGLGPVVLGLLSDLARETWHLDAGNGLRLAMICAAVTFPVAALFFWIGSSTLVRDFKG